MKQTRERQNRQSNQSRQSKQSGQQGIEFPTIEFPTIEFIVKGVRAVIALAVITGTSLLWVPLQVQANVNPSLLKKEEKEKFSKAFPEDINNETFPQTIESFDFRNANIMDLISAIGKITGRNFILDSQDIKGTVTIIAPSKITVAEAWNAFLSALASNGLTIVREGPFTHIRKINNAVKDNLDTFSGKYFPNTNQMITRIVHLKHISAKEVQSILTTLRSRYGKINPYEPTNSLIITELGGNMERIDRILRQLDVPGFEEKMELVPVKYASATEIARLISEITKHQSGGSGSRFSSRNRSSKKAKPSFTVIPDDRTNSLIVVSNLIGVKKIKSLIKRLDFPLEGGAGSGIYVYYVKYGDAEKIAKTLKSVLKPDKTSSKKNTKSTPSYLLNIPKSIFQDKEIQITSDKDTNSLIIATNKQTYNSLLNLIGRIDISRDQVYVESIIMEMRIGDGHNWGLGYYQFNKESNGVGRAGFNTLNIANILNPINGRGAILGFGSKEKVSINTGTNNIELSSLVGFINFIKTVAKTNILATPQLIAMDNEKASFEAGEKVPVSQTLTVGTANNPATQSVNFEDATIKLELTPRISPQSDKVRLEIKQDIKQVSNSRPQAKDLQNSAVILSKRNIETNVVVPSGDTVVLGGLYQNDESVQINKIPLLGDIPILGWFFKSQSVTMSKINLLIFITPTILRSKEGRQALLERKLSERMDFIDSHQRGDYDPYVDTVEKIAKGLPSRQKRKGKGKGEEGDGEEEGTGQKGKGKGKDSKATSAETPIPIEDSEDAEESGESELESDADTEETESAGETEGDESEGESVPGEGSQNEGSDEEDEELGDLSEDEDEGDEDEGDEDEGDEFLNELGGEEEEAEKSEGKGESKPQGDSSSQSKGTPSASEQPPSDEDLLDQVGDDDDDDEEEFLDQIGGDDDKDDEDDEGEDVFEGF